MLIKVTDKIEYIKYKNWKLHYIKYLKFNKKLYDLNYSILITLVFAIFYLYFYFTDTNTFPSWIEQPGLKFYVHRKKTREYGRSS